MWTQQLNTIMYTQNKTELKPGFIPRAYTYYAIGCIALAPVCVRVFNLYCGINDLNELPRKIKMEKHPHT